MLFWLLPRFSGVSIIFNLFRYQTFRAAGAVVTALLVSFLLGPATIRWLRRLRFGQVVRTDGPETHLEKAGTPTMGGVLILLSTAVSTLLWAQINNWYTVLCLVALIWMGLLGFLDDYLKVIRGKPEGLVARYKLLGQFSLGVIVGGFLLFHPISPYSSAWTGVPFFSDWMLVFWAPAYVVFVAVVLAGTSNAVNLSDGLDGLASGLISIAAATFAILAYVTGRIDTSRYLGLFYLPGAGEMAIFAVALSGAAIGFLWFNSHPAEVFMGDTGSLSMGAAIGIMAILVKAEFLLIIVGGVFVLEAVSVILQTSYFKYTARATGTGQRIFRMAPLHHHFEKLGWPETKVVIRFWIIGILFAMLAMSTLKIR